MDHLRQCDPPPVDWGPSKAWVQPLSRTDVCNLGSFNTLAFRAFERRRANLDGRGPSKGGHLHCQLGLRTRYQHRQGWDDSCVLAHTWLAHDSVPAIDGWGRILS